MIAVDPRLDTGEITGFEHLGTNTERSLAYDRLLELGPHRGRNADDHAAVDVARLAADDVAKAAERGQGPHDHLAGLRGGVELADDADRPAGAARGEGVALEDEDVTHTDRRQVEGNGGAGHAASDDDDLGVPDHLDAAAVTSAVSTSSSKRAGSP
jgi:hypothetical protein